jgi:hypothetical protein
MDARDGRFAFRRAEASHGCDLGFIVSESNMFTGGYTKGTAMSRGALDYPGLG